MLSYVKVRNYDFFQRRKQLRYALPVPGLYTRLNLGLRPANERHRLSLAGGKPRISPGICYGHKLYHHVGVTPSVNTMLTTQFNPQHNTQTTHSEINGCSTPHICCNIPHWHCLCMPMNLCSKRKFFRQWQRRDPLKHRKNYRSDYMNNEILSENIVINFYKTLW